MRDISTPLLNVVETGQWAQKVLVRTDRQTDIHVCACIHICTALPSPPHPPLSVCIKFPLETRLKKEKQREVKQNTLIRLWCGYYKDHSSNCVEYCTQSRLQYGRKIIIVLKRVQ